MPLYYADSSALIKLILDEPETPALRAFVTTADLVSSDLVLTELPRAIHRAASRRARLHIDTLLDRVDELVGAVALRPLDRPLLLAAGALAEPALRALDALHLATAIDVLPHDGFVSYDQRQSAAARLLGLRTFAPGV